MTLIILVRLSFVCAINSKCVIEQVDVCVSKQVTIFMNVCTSQRLCVFVTAQKSGLTWTGGRGQRSIHLILRRGLASRQQLPVQIHTTPILTPPTFSDHTQAFLASLQITISIVCDGDWLYPLTSSSFLKNLPMDCRCIYIRLVLVVLIICWVTRPGEIKRVWLRQSLSGINDNILSLWWYNGQGGWIHPPTDFVSDDKYFLATSPIGWYNTPSISEL